MKSALEARVVGTNRVHKAAMEFQPIARAAVEKLIGKKILKADETLTAKVQSELALIKPVIPNVQVILKTCKYWICWTFRTGEGFDERWHYSEISLYVGSIQDAVLISLNQPLELRSDYSVEDVEAKRKACKDAERAYDTARSALFPFGEIDR